MVLLVARSTSFEKEVQPCVLSELQEKGWSILRQIDSSPSELFSSMLNMAILVGQSLSMKNLGYHLLESNGSEERLVAHSEGIANPGGIIPYFALGCIEPSRTGGQTRIFDGRLAASIVNSDPELNNVKVEYSSLSYPNICHAYPLVIPTFGGALRYRARVETNRVINSGLVSEEEMYKRVDSALEKSISIEHQWVAGDMMFVNNNTTLHDRLPFVGKRRMLRIRYNDPQHPKIRY